MTRDLTYLTYNYINVLSIYLYNYVKIKMDIKFPLNFYLKRNCSQTYHSKIFTYYVHWTASNNNI